MTIRIKNLGHSCFLIESIGGIRVLLDPYLRGNVQAAVKVEELPGIDLIAVTHGAFDHMGDTIEIAKKMGAKVFCGPDVAVYLEGNGLTKDQISQLVWGTNLSYLGIEIRSIEAKHISFFEFKGYRISGIPMSFILRMENGTGIYFSGDTAIFSDLKLFGKLYPVKIGIFGMDGIPGLPMEMSGKEAALAAQWLGVELAIPMHFPLGSTQPDEFQKALSVSSPSVRVAILRPGESIDYQENNQTG
jgi:L-ascorbate metabolism protein UlaG (beta-lactamase superfamily)